MRNVTIDVAAMVRAMIAAPAREAEDATPRCGYCHGPLIFGKDLEWGYHTAREDAYSCLDRMQEISE
jgi:hypothetical protein